MHIFTLVKTYIYIYVYTYIYTYTYMHIYICTSTPLKMNIFLQISRFFLGAEMLHSNRHTFPVGLATATATGTQWLQDGAPKIAKLP